MMMQIVGSFAEFEWAMLKESTRHGLEVARAAGWVGAQPEKLTPQQEKEIVAMVNGGHKTGAEAAHLFFGCITATVTRLLAKARAEPGLSG